MAEAPRKSRILITAGPTHEPIDAVRYIGNRSSGRLGIALTAEAAARGHDVTLLLGPTGLEPPASARVHRFRTCADLQGLLREHAPKADVLVMAAAVADYRPRPDASVLTTKLRRNDRDLVLELESTPDLLAEVAAARRERQLLVGFALEPRAEMLGSARAKLERKRVDLVVANPLETMDSDTVEAVVVDSTGRQTSTPGVMSKCDFAPWLMDVIMARAGGA